MILPYARNPLHPVRRDMVVSSADCIALRVTVVERDDPSAQPLVVTGGLGGPMARLVIWRDTSGGYWDYGCAAANFMQTLWSGDGTISTEAIGSFDFHVPAGTAADWPQRCGWSVHLDWQAQSGVSADMLWEGILNVRRVAQKIIPPTAITTDSDVAILVA